MMVCKVTRTTLFCGCWATRVLPPLPAPVRKVSERGFLAPYFSFSSLAQIRRAALNLATSSRTLLNTLKLKAMRGAKSSTSMPRDRASSR